MNRWDVVNLVTDHTNAKTYLEIGVSDGQTMSKLRAPFRIGVDPAPHASAVGHCSIFVGKTSDVFFDMLDRGQLKLPPLDLVFIDSFHEAELSYREVKNCLRYLRPNGVIVLHDCNPTTEAMQIVPAIQGEWTGDVWRAIARLRSEAEHDVRVVRSDYGIGVVLAGKPARHKIDLGKRWSELGYADLVARRIELLGLIEPQEFLPWLQRAWKRADAA
jgi:SAM-dependent methyltransferase